MVTSTNEIPFKQQINRAFVCPPWNHGEVWFTIELLMFFSGFFPTHMLHVKYMALSQNPGTLGPLTYSKIAG